MFGKLVLIFILVPLADLVLLLMLADYTGWRFSIGAVVVSGIIGAWLARQQSRFVRRKIRDQLQHHLLPAELLTDGAMIFFAAGLLLTPGFITDFIGLTLLIPVCRQWYKKWALRILKKHFQFQIVTMDTAGQAVDPSVIDGEVVEKTSASEIPNQSGGV